MRNKIHNLPKSSPQFTTKLDGYLVSYPNQQEFRSLKQEIFVRHDYYFDAPEDEAPPVSRIVDIGAHIGLSALYFAKQYPVAQIVAVEPHPDALEYLRDNIWNNHLEEQVEVIEAAVVPEVASTTEAGAASPRATQPTTTTTLYTDPTDGWWSTTSVHTGAWTGDQETEAITVASTTLAALLNQPTDIVKIDIEGAEQAVLLSQSRTTLELIATLFVEFHPHPSQSLYKLVEFLSKMGFRQIECWQDGKKVTKPSPDGTRWTNNRLVLVVARR